MTGRPPPEAGLRQGADRRQIASGESESTASGESESTDFSRDELRKYFYKGALPSADHFHDLINATVNKRDDGFSRTADDGLRINPEASLRLISFFRSFGGRALWRMELGTSPDDSLVFRREGDDEQLLTLSADGRIGVAKAHPEQALDVGGFLKSEGRVGSESIGDDGKVLPTPVADGAWHPVTGKLYGLQALEVVAGVAGKRGDGEYALVHAIAINAFNARGWYFNPFGFNFLHRKNKIHIRQAHYRSRRDKLELRWNGDEHEFELEIRSRQPYGSDKVKIHYHITNLWPWGTNPHGEDGKGDADQITAGQGAVSTLGGG